MLLSVNQTCVTWMYRVIIASDDLGSKVITYTNYLHTEESLGMRLQSRTLGVWGELVNYKRSLTHCPGSQGWAPECPIHFVFVCTVSVWCVGPGFPSFLLFLYNYLSYIYVVCYTYVYSCTIMYIHEQSCTCIYMHVYW